MTMNGIGSEQIATALERDGILTPTNYYLIRGIRRPGIKDSAKPDAWNSSTVIKILGQREYCGDVVNFKTFSKSYKVKKRIENSEENMKIFLDIHQPIIDRAVWEKVQIQRGKIRKRTQNNGERSMFSGMLFCADCGGNMNFHFNQRNPDIEYFNCSNNNKARKTCDKTHYIRVDFLEQVVLGEIRRLTKFASRHEQQFAEIVMGQSKQFLQDGLNRKRKELAAMKLRDRELDRLFQSLYESNQSGKISDERFAKMSASYELEQGNLATKIKSFATELERESSKSVTADMFIGAVRGYTRAKKLTPRMLAELVERIEVFHAEKASGVHIQRLTIHYNCVGEIAIPEMLSIPAPDVRVRTRRGVTVAYGDGVRAADITVESP